MIVYEGDWNGEHIRYCSKCKNKIFPLIRKELRVYDRILGIPIHNIHYIYRCPKAKMWNRHDNYEVVRTDIKEQIGKYVNEKNKDKE